MGRVQLEKDKSTIGATLLEQVSGRKFKDNLRAYTMVFALLLSGWLWLLLHGYLLEPRNLSNLFRQTAINGILAIGMVFVIPQVT